MVDLIHTLWKPSLKDAITTFKDNLQEQDRLLSHTNNISVTKVHLKDIIISHNALVKTMNSMVNKTDEVETINLGI